MSDTVQPIRLPTRTLLAVVVVVGAASTVACRFAVPALLETGEAGAKAATAAGVIVTAAAVAGVLATAKLSPTGPLGLFTGQIAGGVLRLLGSLAGVIGAVLGMRLDTKTAMLSLVFVYVATLAAETWCVVRAVGRETKSN